MIRTISLNSIPWAQASADFSTYIYTTHRMKGNDHESPNFSFLELLFSPTSAEELTRMLQEQLQSQSRLSPEFLDTLDHLRSPLAPFVSVVSGRPHPDFPKTILAYHLLTSAQLDALFAYYHQVWPPVPETYMYPIAVPPQIVADQHWDVDIEEKRRWFGCFIGLGGSEVPLHVAVPDVPNISWMFLDRRETVEQMLERMEREWQEALRRAKFDFYFTFQWKGS